MNQNQRSIPRLDLAPKLRRPLSLLNPFDYLLLLCWVFFFPQALRWYVNPLGRESIPKGHITRQKVWKLLRQNYIVRQLILQGLTLVFLPSLVLYCIWRSIGVPFDPLLLVNNALVSLWVSTLFGLFGTWVVGQKYGVTLGVASGVGSGVIFGLTWLPIVLLLKGMIFGALPSLESFIASFVGNQLANTFEASLKNGILFGILFGTVWVVALSIVSGVAFGLWHCWRFGLPLGVVICFLQAQNLGWASGLTSGMGFGLGFALASGVAILRVDNWLLALPLTVLPDLVYSRLMPRVTPLPIVYLYSRLKSWLRQDWETGLYNANELLKYSLQFNTVINAISQVLSESLQEQLILRVSKLAETPYDWRLVEFVSKKLCLAADIDDFDDLKPPLNNTANAAVATTAFWYLYNAAEVEENRRVLTKGYINKAEEGFRLLRSLQYGEEMFTLAQTLATFASASEFASIAFLQSPPIPKQLVVRKVSWEAIICLNRVVEDARAIQRSVSRSARDFALNHALEELNSTQEKTNSLPQAERNLIAYIAQTWKESLQGIASKVEKISITKPVCNPYVVGNPVQDKLFVGREDVLRQLEEIWVLAQQLQSVVIYGHRRMGKSSILNNIGNHLGGQVKVAYVNLQRYEFQQVADILIAITDEIANVLNISPPADEDIFNFPHRTFLRYLKKIEPNLQEKALIVAIDEFEKIEEQIQSGKLDKNFIGFLRGLMQMNPQIAFAFAGLHTLEEMTQDYFQPFFASVIPIHVSFLKLASIRQLLENPTEDFALSYTLEAITKIYDLTAGQPYLVQLMGFQLVRRFNDQVFEQGLSRNPVFTEEDVEEAIKDPEFFNRGRYYFTGVWGQAVQGVSGQQTILRSIAPYPEGLTINAIAQATGIEQATVEEALNTLKRHDVVRETDGRWYIIVELFRRWVLDL